MWISGFSAEKEKPKPKPNEKQETPTWWPHWTCISHVEKYACPLYGTDALPSWPLHTQPKSLLGDCLLIAQGHLSRRQLLIPFLASKLHSSVSHCLWLCLVIRESQLFNPGCTLESSGAQGKNPQVRLHPRPVKSESRWGVGGAGRGPA